jgi:hypothetical protein
MLKLELYVINDIFPSIFLRLFKVVYNKNYFYNKGTL